MVSYHLEDFLEQTNPKFKMIDKKIKNFIIKQSVQDSPKETCGFIVFKDNFICIPCKNTSKDPEQFFKISSIDFLRIKKMYNKIYYIYHSHTNENCDFSETDKTCAENLNLPIILYNIKKNIFKIHNPVRIQDDLIGRFYEYKKYDCFTLIKDFYYKQMNIDLSVEYGDLDKINIKKLFLENYTNKNFILIDDIKNICNHDILLIDGIKDSSHCAIYLGDNKILHQPINTFSKIENYCNFYKRHTKLLFRPKI